jgi:tetrahydrodipicolinate N-succinyltransferase
VTHPSKSKTRSVAAIGNGCVIPAKAGIQGRSTSKSKTRSVAAIGNGCFILAKAGIRGLWNHC